MTETAAAPRESLTERYRPRKLSDVVGQDEIVLQIRGWLDDPVPCAFLFGGGTGTGKTSLAMALAREIGCDVDEAEYGGYYDIASGEQTADALRDLFPRLWTRPMSGTGWRVVVINEADRMSDACAYLWLSQLEAIPPQTVYIFTTNHASKMDARFRHRCEPFEFSSDAAAIREDVQRRVNEIWFAETGRTDAPRVDEMPGAIEGGKISVRAAVGALNPYLRRVKAGTYGPAVVASAEPAEPSPDAPPDAAQPPPVPDQATPRKAPCNLRKADPSIDWHAIGDAYRRGARVNELAERFGATRQAVWSRLSRMGYLDRS
jgi:hypothetical protein